MKIKRPQMFSSITRECLKIIGERGLFADSVNREYEVEPVHLGVSHEERLSALRDTHPVCVWPFA